MKRTGQLLFVAAVFALVLFAATAPAFGAPGDQARIFVQYAPGEAAAARGLLERAGARFHYDFPEIESYVVTVPAAAVAGLERSPFVVGTEEDVPRYLFADGAPDIASTIESVQAAVAETEPYGIGMVQAPDMWAAGFTGNGVKVCIIDTGYYRQHEDLQGIPVSGTSQVGTSWETDGYGHGTHVAGTIAAQGNEVGVVGVSESVSLYIVKFFNDDGNATLASDLIAAAYDCRDNGADIISMSLGGSRSNGRESRAFSTLYSQGILSIAAAGNDGNTAYNYPASYDSVVSVAAIDSSKAIADFSQQNDQVELAAPGVGVLSTVPFIATNSLTVDGVAYSANHIEFAPLGSASGPLVNGGLCTAPGSWNGAVVLCERGDISFYDKVINAQNGGAAAAVIYNNAPGGFLGTLGDGNSSNIVAISISQEDGQFLVANKLGSAGTVESSLEKPASGYEAWDGTSMATPHVSAVAALVWGAAPGASNAQIREALTQSAQDLGAAGRDNTFGFGLVQAKAAYDYLTGGNPPPPPPPGGGDLVVSVSTDRASYVNRDTVTITVQVTDGSNAVSGATVDVAIQTAAGRTLGATATTGADGSAVVTYKVNARRDGTGTYTVDATASKAGYNSGSGSTSFTVN